MVAISEARSSRLAGDSYSPWFRAAAPVALRLAGSLGIVAAVTYVCFQILRVNATTAGFAYLVAVLGVATSWGLLEAASASVAAVLCFNYFFFPPIRNFTISDPQNWVALLAFFATSLIASQVSAHARQRTREAVDRQRDLERLYALSRSILLTPTEDGIARQIAQQIAQVFDFRAGALYDRGTGAIYNTGPEDLTGLDDRLRESALKGTLFRDEGTQTVVTAIRLGGEPIGALALRGPLPSDTVLQALANLAAIGLEKARAQQAASHALAARQSQELKSTLLDAMAHEFKTPLTSMKAATSALLSDVVSEPGSRRELITVVDEEIDHLNRLVTEAIRMARIEAGDVQLTRSRCAVEPMLKAVLDSMEAAIAGRPVSLQVPADVPYVNVDAGLIELVIRQLVDNALRYSPPPSPLVVRAGRTPQGVVIGIRDHGPGIAQEEHARVFEKYYRGSTASRARGTGLGLAIAREIARAHGGDVWLETSSPQGSEFCLSLPVAPGEDRS